MTDSLATPWPERTYDFALVTAALQKVDEAGLRQDELNAAEAALGQLLPPTLEVPCPHRVKTKFTLNAFTGADGLAYFCTRLECGKCREAIGGDDAIGSVKVDDEGDAVMLGINPVRDEQFAPLGLANVEMWQHRVLILAAIVSSLDKIATAKSVLLYNATEAALALLDPIAEDIAEQLLEEDSDIPSATLYSASVAATT